MVLKEKKSVATAMATESAYHKNHFLQMRAAQRVHCLTELIREHIKGVFLRL